MATVAQVVVDGARATLQDESNVAERWIDATLLKGLIEAEGAVVNLRHEAFTEVLSFASTGLTQNDLPAGSVAIIDVRRNLGANGTTPGRSIRRVGLEWMDLADPDWHSAEVAEEALHWMFDPRDSHRFYLWPPTTSVVEVVQSVLPPVITLGQNINLADIYVPALRAYIVHYAFAQDSDNANNEALSSKWYNHFIYLVTGKKVAEEALERGRHRAP